MNNSKDDDLNLNDEIKFSNGIQNLGDEMARLFFSKNNNIEEVKYILAYDDFYKNNRGKTSNLQKQSSANQTKKENNNKNSNINLYSNKSLPKASLKKKAISFANNNKNPKKRETLNKNKFSNKKYSQQLKDSIKDNNKNKGNKKYIQINDNRISVIDKDHNFIKHINTNPKKVMFKFLNKKSNENNLKDLKKSQELKNLISENKKMNSDNIKNKNSFPVNNLISNNKNSIQSLKNLKTKDSNNIYKNSSNMDNNNLNSNDMNNNIDNNVNSKNNLNNHNNINNLNNNNNDNINDINNNKINDNTNDINNNKNNDINDNIRNDNNCNKSNYNNNQDNNIYENNNNNQDNNIYENNNNNNNNNNNKNYLLNDSSFNNINFNKNNDNSLNNEFDSEELDEIEIDIIKPDISEKSTETNLDINKNILYKKNYLKTKGKKGIDRLYYVEMRNLEKRNKRIDKQRERIIEEKLSKLKPGPEINQRSYDIISNLKEEYIPIQERAGQIHKNHLTKIILCEMQKTVKEEEKEKKDLEIIKRYKSKKVYNEEEWNNFVERQYEWEEEVKYKRKAEDILNNEKFMNNSNRLYMNSRSRNIINKMLKKNISMDNVYDRLYNDVNIREEKLVALNNKYTPSFKPKHSINYKKFINKRKIPKTKSELIVTNYNKNNFFFDSQISINNGFIDIFNNNKRNKCKYCYLRDENSKNSAKSKLLNNSTIFTNRKTTINTIDNFSRIGTSDSILPTEIYTLNRNNYNYKKRSNQTLDNKSRYCKNKNKIMGLKKTINHNTMNNKDREEEEKQIYKEKTFYNENRKMFRNNKRNINFNNSNKTINITDNNYRNFFNFENIEEL